MSELQILRQRESLISSQFLFEVNASDTNVPMSPFYFACANLVLLLPVKSETVSISVDQSSNGEESFPFRIVISCSKEFTKDSFEHYIKCLYIDAKLPQWVPMVWPGKV